MDEDIYKDQEFVGVLWFGRGHFCARAASPSGNRWTGPTVYQTKVENYTEEHVQLGLEAIEVHRAREVNS